MYQAIGMDTKKVYAEGSRADCFRTINKEYPYIANEKNTSKWGKGNHVTDKPIFNEPLLIVKKAKLLKGR